VGGLPVWMDRVRYSVVCGERGRLVHSHKRKLPEFGWKRYTDAGACRVGEGEIHRVSNPMGEGKLSR
jgi:hypothetical protein